MVAVRSWKRTELCHATRLNIRRAKRVVRSSCGSRTVPGQFLGSGWGAKLTSAGETTYLEPIGFANTRPSLAQEPLRRQMEKLRNLQWMH